MQQMAIAQWAHDIRNALGTIALYVEALDQPTDARKTRIVASTHAMLTKAAAMCSDAVKNASRTGPGTPQRCCDVTATVRQIADLVAPTLPSRATIEVSVPGPVEIMAEPHDMFRIVFNLVHNAATLARRHGSVSRITLTVERTDAMAVIRIADDGPGLPQTVRARMFRQGRSTTGGNGYGLAIARELAERNGAVLELAKVPAGTTFLMEVPLVAASDETDVQCRRAA
jgi:signal transduction histidine kinase